MKKIIFTLIFCLLLVGCTSNNTPNNNENQSNQNEVPTKVKIGLIGGDAKPWNYVKEEAAKENIEIEFIVFDSYSIPNAALNSGEIDMNSFQHYNYFNKEVEELGYDISVMAETILAPLGLYSKKITSLDELQDGDSIIIPDDVTNGGRSLLFLEKNGLIKVNEDAKESPTLKDIENPRNFKITELSATNIPASLEEVTLAAINSGVARDAGIIPTQDSIALEDATTGDNPYINIIAVRTKDLDNEVLKRVVEIYRSDKTKEIILEDTKGSSIPVW